MTACNARYCRSRRRVDDAAAPDRHETQYFEMFGNRGIYHKGWTAVTKHRTPWETGVDVEPPAFDDDVWENSVVNLAMAFQ